MESGFSSPRTGAFPAGLRVLVVDDDLAWLRILEKMLKKCSYEVTTCCLAREALDLLRERKDGFDIVISDVNMPDMDGFKLLEHVGLEMDLPVIMMSVDGETSRVMRGVQHGACDYLLKPIRMKELRNIWQHVFRKRILEVRDIESLEGIDEIQMMRHGLDQFDDGHFLSAGELVIGKKRKDAENKHEEREYGDPSSVKKARVVWTVDLHQKFVNAVNQIGFDKGGPKKILDLMNVPWLTRENVASHLQKYRLYLGRLQKENELKASCVGIKQSDLSSKEPAESLGLQNPMNLQQNVAARGTCSISGNRTAVQNVDPKNHEGDLKSISLLPIKEPKKAVIHEIADPPKASCSRMGLTHSFGPLEPDVKYASFDSMPKQYSWHEAPKIQFKQDNGFNHLPSPDPHNPFQIDCVELGPSVSPRSFNTKSEKIAFEIKSSCTDKRCQQILETIPLGGATSLFPIHLSEPIPSTAPTIKPKDVNQVFINDPGSAQQNLIPESCSGFASSNGDLFSCLLQGDNYKTNVELQNKEPCYRNCPELFAETPVYLYDAQRLDYEYPWESIEYPVMDQGLFIV